MKLAKPVNDQQCQNCDEIALVKIQVTHGAIMLCAACAGEMRTLLSPVSDVLVVSANGVTTEQVPANMRPCSPSPAEIADNADRQAETDYAHSDGAHSPEDDG